MVWTNRRKGFRRINRKTAARKIGALVRKGWRTYKNNRGTVGALARDVMMLKSLVNAEKKYIDFDDTFTFAQRSGAVSDHYISPLCSISEGTTVSTRTGNSVKMTSLQYKIVIGPQASAILNVGTKYTLYFVMHPGRLPDSTLTTGSAGTLITQFLNPDSSTYYSTRSFREREHFKDWIVLRRIDGYYKADQAAADGDKLIDHQGYIKLWQHLKFETGSGAVVENQIYLVAVANNGNAAVGTTTGLACIIDWRLNYIDN